MRPSANSAAFSWRIHLSRWPAVSAVHPRGQRLLFHARGVVRRAIGPYRAPASVKSRSHAPAIAFHATRHSDRRAPRSLARCSYRLEGGVILPEALAAEMDENEKPSSRASRQLL